VGCMLRRVLRGGIGGSCRCCRYGHEGNAFFIYYVIRFEDRLMSASSDFFIHVTMKVLVVHPSFLYIAMLVRHKLLC